MARGFPGSRHARFSRVGVRSRRSAPPSPYPSTRIPKGLTEIIPDPSQAGPVRARFSRGWAEIGVASVFPALFRSASSALISGKVLPFRSRRLRAMVGRLPAIGALRAPPPLPRGIPDWRALARGASQPIPDWRRFQRFGLNWRRVWGCFTKYQEPITKGLFC